MLCFRVSSLSDPESRTSEGEHILQHSVLAYVLVRRSIAGVIATEGRGSPFVVTYTA
jgi:hypothetical protein